MTDETITKRKVTMTNVTAQANADGLVEVLTTTAVDYVRPDFLEAYLAANRPNWQSVVVSEEPDAGPGGYHGATYVPDNLEHPLAGQMFEATNPTKKG